MKIFKFDPIFKPTLWGGSRIAPLKGVEAKGLANIGESWEISGVKGNESTVSDGPWRGHTLRELINRMKADLVGHHVYDLFGNEFPLLFKYIDARLDLSIQVHPNDDLALRRHGSRGKTEMWYIIAAEDDAAIYPGFDRPMTPEEYLRAVEDHSIPGCLRRCPVAPGDTFLLPAGRVHSIGGGTLLAEIQVTSDITYRIYDFDRRDAQGNLRRLHTELALDAIDFGAEADYRIPYAASPNTPTTLVDSPYFITRLLSLNAPATLPVAALDSFLVVMTTEGEIAISTPEGERRTCPRGHTLLVAASASDVTLTPLTPSASALLCNL